MDAVEAFGEFIVDASIHEFAHFCRPLGADEAGHAMAGDGRPMARSLWD